MKINEFEDMLIKKKQLDQKQRKKRISMYRKSKLKLREANQQKSKINRLIIE